MADLMAMGRKVVIGNSPLDKSYSANAPVTYLGWQLSHPCTWDEPALRKHLPLECVQYSL